MKNLYFILIVVVFAPKFALTQLTWNQQTTPGTQLLFQVSFVDANNGWAVGNAAQTVWKTTDGGVQWTSYPVIGASYPTSVCFVNTSVGWLVDYYGTIHKSIDGGITWTQQYTNSGGDNFYSSFFVNDQTGWVSSNVNNMYTIDGGASWFASVNPVYATSGTAIDIEFVDENIGYVLGPYPGLNFGRSINGGNLWTTTAMPIVNPISMYAFAISSVNKIWAVGTEGTIMHSSDGGVTWVAQGVGLTTEFLLGVDFYDDNNGVVTGNGGTILTTSDGGVTWIINNSTTTVSLYDVKMISPSEIWAVGGNGTILKSSAQSDLEVISFVGNNTVCENTPFNAVVNVKNYGPVTVTSANFTVLDGITPVLSYNWSGSLSPGLVETIDLGTMSISGGTILTIALSGDSVTTNNDYFQTMSVFNDGTTGTNGPLTVCPSDALTMYGYGGLTYHWLNATPDSTLQFQYLIATQSTNYYVEITTPNCVILDSVVVTVNADDCLTNAFSPNDDGINDAFHIDGLTSTENTVTIFTRWGDEIISISNYDNINSFWNGRDKSGKLVTEGSYFYTVDAPGGASFAGFVQVVN